ncbi:ABC transporter permease [Bacillus sp. FJAT-42376]|uniref:FtsX-like permease family protein n=1 Tax=Bacillus sp. FJAT-42376 TaxID=2014076 RepID=UPI000F4F2082|nr:FtsX-like permease family protein [Bacillus sp. FJAT-42376]AZB41323.1 ABC transporter permease [Bacillus sp. FJAT-42376]
MTFSKLALNNVLRNGRTYAAYFLSSAFSVFVFFIYAVLAFHPELTAARLKDASTGMHFAESIIYVFTFFFILYSMSTFLKTRKKEFGLLIMHGMTKLQLRKLVFLENMVIGILSTLFGIGTGLLASKGLLILGSYVIGLTPELPFYVPQSAIVLTLSAFTLLFFIISLFTAAVLRGNKLIDLLMDTEKPRPEPKASRFRSILAGILLLGGYAAAIAAKGVMVVTAMIPVTIVVVIGTYFLFTQASVWIISKLKKNERIYLNRTNIVTFSDLSYRMKDNARMFFIVSIVSTVAFAAIGTLAGFRALMTNSVKQQEPYAFVYQSAPSDQQKDERIRQIEKELKGTDYEKLSVPYKQPEGGNQAYTFMSQSDYNRTAAMWKEPELSLKKGEAAIMQEDLLYPRGLVKGDEPQSITVNGLPGKIKKPKVLEELLFSMSLFKGDLVILPDQQFAAIKAEEKSYTAYRTENASSTLAAGKKLEQSFSQKADPSFLFTSSAVKIDQVKQSINIFLFVGLFIGFVFFAAAGSFLYFRLYADFEGDVKKYQAISKIGLTDKEMKKIVTVQMSLLFFVPVGVAAAHGFVALIALGNMFGTRIWTEIAMVLGSFMLIQVIYFLIIRIGYVKKVKRAI